MGVSAAVGPAAALGTGASVVGVAAAVRPTCTARPVAAVRAVTAPVVALGGMVTVAVSAAAVIRPPRSAVPAATLVSATASRAVVAVASTTSRSTIVVGLLLLIGALGKGCSRHEEGVVDLGIAGEVLRDGLLGDVLDLDAGVVELLDVGLEAPEVAREDGAAVPGEQARDADDELGMVALDVPGTASHAFRVREGGHVAEDEVPAVLGPTLLVHPAEDVGLHVLVVAAVEAVALHVAARPCERRAAHVHRGRVLGPAVGGVAGGGARVGEEVEEAL